MRTRTLYVSAGLSVLPWLAYAAPGDRQQQRRPTRLVSELLPEPLADFVLRYGVDREVEVTKHVLQKMQNLSRMEGKPVDVIEALQPVAYFQLDGPARIAPPENRANDVLLIAGTRIHLSDSTTRNIAESVETGSVVTRGLLLNSGTVDVILETPRGRYGMEPGEAVLIVSNIAANTAGGVSAVGGEVPVIGPIADGDPGGEVTCGDGYYACCTHAGWIKSSKCVCVRNGTEKDCDAGGPGATSCAILPVE